ncbi:MAG: sortase [Actinomycetota bacterium]|nr:MAG: sortase [Actinomycetota bacterium]
MRNTRFVTRHRLRLGIGGALVLLAVGGVIYPLIWQHHQNSAGQQIINRDIGQARSGGTISKVCTARPGPGVLVIPALGLTAPVEQGLSDSVLEVAIGHDPSTSWPGPGQSSLLAGHDVGYLSQDTKLKTGDAISYIEPCATVNFVVERQVISKPYQQITVPPQGGLVLDSCWPTDALWYTPERYLVIARYVSTTHGSPVVPIPPASPEVPVVNLPPGLTLNEVSLAANAWPMGNLLITGTPSTQWVQSQAALQAESHALELFFGLRRSIAENVPAWSASLAPGVSVPNWLAGVPNSPLNVTEEVAGTAVAHIALSSSVISLGRTVHFTVTAVAVGSALLVTSVQQVS